MSPRLRRGTLVKWMDDRGFGFIQSDDESQEVFLHISALGRTARRPRVGDIILYESMAQPRGKVRAVKASIQGVASYSSSSRATSKRSAKHRRSGGRSRSFWSVSPYRNWKRQHWLLRKLIGLGVVGMMLLLANTFAPSFLTSRPNPECVIKGNISHNSQRKWYHMPGMEDYESTKINPGKGERWFCSEQEAIAAGWTKAPR